MLNKAGNSRMDALLKIVLIFVLSVLSFSIGAFVGKQVSDTEHRQALLENEFGGDRSTASINPQSTKHRPHNALSDEDISSLTEEFVNVEKKSLAENKKLAPTKKLDSKNTESKDDSSDGYKRYGKKITQVTGDDLDLEPISEVASASSKYTKPIAAPTIPAQRVAQGVAPTQDPPKVRVPTSVLPSTPSSALGKFTIQVGAYTLETEAKAHAEALKEKGYEAFYIAANIKGNDWYRVNIGLFPDHKSATAYRQEKEQAMSEAGIKSSYVQKITK